MRLTWKDGLATLFTAAVVGIYVAFLAGAFESVRWSAAGMLILGFAACASGGSEITGRAWLRRALGFFGALALLAGLFAIFTANEIALAVLAGATVGLWLAATLRHILTETREDSEPRSHVDSGTRERTLTG